MCLCGNYCDLNAGRAGESGCLLINEGSRWPCGGRELQHSEHGQVVSARRTHTNTWAVNTGGQRVSRELFAYCYVLLYRCIYGSVVCFYDRILSVCFAFMTRDDQECNTTKEV